MVRHVPEPLFWDSNMFNGLPGFDTEAQFHVPSTPSELYYEQTSPQQLYSSMDGYCSINDSICNVPHYQQHDPNTMYYDQEYEQMPPSALLTKDERPKEPSRTTLRVEGASTVQQIPNAVYGQGQGIQIQQYARPISHSTNVESPSPVIAFRKTQTQKDYDDRQASTCNSAASAR